MCRESYTCAGEFNRCEKTNSGDMGVGNTATHCNATHCNTLQHTATHKNTRGTIRVRGYAKGAIYVRGHTATYCSTTHCNTLHHTVTREDKEDYSCAKTLLPTASQHTATH